jgi:GT2 family glycosyltransferase
MEASGHPRLAAEVGRRAAPRTSDHVRYRSLAAAVLDLPEGRPTIGGKFLHAAGEKLYVRGVTYGAFRPNAEGVEFHDQAQIDRDFAQMAANGINAVRIPHTTPPRSLLDTARRHGLWVMVGLSAEQMLGFVIDRRKDTDPAQVVRERVRSIAGHPALLCYALGNEITANVARWYGNRRIERYLERLYRAVKDEDPEGLVTYVNYPSTEYLDLPFLDLVSFNVYLESREPLEAYIARLQNVAADRPLLLTEVGLDSLRNGTIGQARALSWQIATAFSGGCAGAFVFAWTDDWHRGEEDVHDWAFGITDRLRRPKPALAATRAAYGQVPHRLGRRPRISVVVCTYNGSRTIAECLRGLEELDYPDFEIIVVDDGSTDDTADIVAGHADVRLIRTENRGLSSARNTGMHAATGEIVAYIDDDAFPDAHWLQYLATTFETTKHAGVGGPNVPPPGDGWVADCVANAPGGPTHVLLSDRVAEHIPGCNMAFRKSALEAIGGFDSQFRVAGDDVDVCWRLQERGWTLGFHPAAQVWHHRRNCIRTYWRQQRGYGRAEGLLRWKWPKKYTNTGQMSWSGRIYSHAMTRPLVPPRSRIYHGTWGAAPFQRLYHSSPGTLYSLSLTPEWYLAVPALAALALLGLLWPPLLVAIPVLAAATLAPMLQAWATTKRARFTSEAPADRSPGRRLKLRLVTTFLHILHPVARLWGRLEVGAWKPTPDLRPVLPRPRSSAQWVPYGDGPEERLRTIERSLGLLSAPMRRGGPWDRWDLEVQGGALGAARLILAVEDHAGGNQLIRTRCWPSVGFGAWALLVGLIFLAAGAAADGAFLVTALLGGAAAWLVARTARQCGLAVAAIERGIQEPGK